MLCRPDRCGPIPIRLSVGHIRSYPGRYLHHGLARSHCDQSLPNCTEAAAKTQSASIILDPSYPGGSVRGRNGNTLPKEDTLDGPITVITPMNIPSKPPIAPARDSKCRHSARVANTVTLYVHVLKSTYEIRYRVSSPRPRILQTEPTI